MFHTSKAESIQELNEKLKGSEVKYRFSEDGKTIQVEAGRKVLPFKLHRMAHDSKEVFTESDEYFNRTVKRDHTILVSGDRPRFALLRHQAQATLCPDITKIGDCRIGIEQDGKVRWIDEADRIRTTFYPGYTDYTIQISEEDACAIECQIFQIENQGGGCRIRIQNHSNRTSDIRAVFEYGGVMTVQRTFHASYFSPEDRKTEGNRVWEEGSFAELTTEGIRQKATIVTDPQAKPVVSNFIVRYEIPLSIAAGSEKSCFLAAVLSDADTPSWNAREVLSRIDPDECIAESEKYYFELTRDIGMSTPNKLLDAAFLQALYNFDYIYTAPAWLEGVHWWGAPWCNNYQMSAALSIHQKDRIREALRFFASPKEGPCATIHSDGTPEISWLMNTNDGLPYYLYQLTEYYQHTGDLDLMRELWDKVVDAVDKIMTERDAKGNHLLGWHMGCNAFLYQADHLQLPGEGTSPSIMMAGMLSRLSEIARDIGQEELADKWRSLSETMFRRVLDVLWNRKDGVFYSHVDMEEIRHMCHYYTDMVFPVLYSDLPDETKWQSLEYLNRTLWTEDLFGENKLMRVGDYKPTIFGSDNVMPVQMAEAARAYQKIGDYDRGIRLLEGVALAGTLFTEAPGNFPERMNDLGKGEANYVFGNPIGSFVYTMVEGLMGAAVIDSGKTLRVQPGIPREWEYAKFSLPYVKINYKKEQKEQYIRQTYSVENLEQEQIRLAIFLDPGHSLRVTHNDVPVDFELKPALNTIFLTVTVKNKLKNELAIEYIPVSISCDGDTLLEKGKEFLFRLNREIASVSDANEICKELNVEGFDIRGVLNEREGKAVLYARLREIPVIIPIRLESRSNYLVQGAWLTYDATQKTITAMTKIHAIHPTGNEKLSARVTGVENHKEAEKEAKIVYDTSNHAEVSICREEAKPLPEGVYEVLLTVHEDGRELYSIKQRVDLSGTDKISTEIIRSMRDRNLETVDLSQVLNSREIYAMTRWRSDVPMIYYVEQLPEGKIDTSYGSFQLQHDAGNYLCLLRKGSSNRVTGEPVDFDGITEVTIPIGKKVWNVALFFAGEVESRHTFGVVGEYELLYDDHSSVKIPMQVGVNIDTLFSHFASDTIEINQPQEVWKGNSWDVDSMNAYRIPCDPAKTLMGIRIRIIPYDVNFGLMAVNVTIRGGEQ
jgi:hypothetical protein